MELTWYGCLLVADVENASAGVDADVRRRTAIIGPAERGLRQKASDTFLT